jgi:hypothetical protein
MNPNLNNFISILNLQTNNPMSVELNQKPEPIFADGMSFKRNEKAPDYVIGQMSFKVEEAINFLKANSKNGWVNVDIKRGRSGKEYVQLSTYEPKPKPTTSHDDSPF